VTTYRMTIRNASPGLLLLRSGSLVFKTEYNNDKGDPECYVAESGEHYHGAGLDVDCIEVTQDVLDGVRDKWET
jgi:hypothetical protein